MCCGSVLVCATYKWEITDSIPGWAELCSNVVLLGKTLGPHVHSRDPGVSGYLVGQWRLMCLNSSARWQWHLGCMLSGELRRLMNEQVLWPGGQLHEVGQVVLHTTYKTINLHLYVYSQQADILGDVHGQFTSSPSRISCSYSCYLGVFCVKQLPQFLKWGGGVFSGGDVCFESCSPSFPRMLPSGHPSLNMLYLFTYCYCLPINMSTFLTTATISKRNKKKIHKQTTHDMICLHGKAFNSLPYPAEAESLGTHFQRVIWGEEGFASHAELLHSRLERCTASVCQAWTHETFMELPLKVYPWLKLGTDAFLSCNSLCTSVSITALLQSSLPLVGHITIVLDAAGCTTEQLSHVDT